MHRRGLSFRWSWFAGVSSSTKRRSHFKVRDFIRLQLTYGTVPHLPNAPPTVTGSNGKMNLFSWCLAILQVLFLHPVELIALGAALVYVLVSPVFPDHHMRCMSILEI